VTKPLQKRPIIGLFTKQYNNTLMEQVTPTIHSATDFAYEEYEQDVPVMAYNRATKQWEMAELYEVEDGISPYTRFFFVDELPTPKEDSKFDAAKAKLDEMINWINRWSVKAPAVDEALNGFRTSIHEILDQIEES
jgi:hypothetical protein